ncbi:MAG: family ATPase [Bacteroidetes bacterium]|nr:family ATPase [Bacteroidota bacterium]
MLLVPCDSLNFPLYLVFINKHCPLLSEIMTTSHNDTFRLAADLVMFTYQNIFLTGKAGTGKTTFLHYIRKHTRKQVIVAAPTGVAAINAGGVTLHSLFQLPFEAFVPDFEGRRKLDYHFRVRKSKVEMFRELELLIIDEVSMLRADTLDAIDVTLKRFRGNSRPFGGVQVLFIGDLFQLPPVVHNDEWEKLKPHYASPFFFDAQVLKNNLPVCVELTKVYRQTEQSFVDILNRIRVNAATPDDFQFLNKRYQPNFQLTRENKYVVLSTHNYRTDRINEDELAKLSGRTEVFHGSVKGEFSDSSLPTEMNLRLKVGAQVMFVKNDSSDKKRYYNGKLAEVTVVKPDSIFVRFEDGEEMEVEPETWQNIRYSMNEAGEIEEQEIGSFSQYPLRLAWAITIHKSQGLTFDRVVIDAGQAFAAGQVYVALSRCTSLDGIVLHSRIEPKAVTSNEDISAFSELIAIPEKIEDLIAQEKPHYCSTSLKRSFEWLPALRLVDSFRELIESKKLPNEEEAMAVAYQIRSAVMTEISVADKFRQQLDEILRVDTSEENRIQILRDRVGKAVAFFKQDFVEKVLRPMENHLASLQHASKVKLYLKNSRKIYEGLFVFISKMDAVYYGETLLSPENPIPIKISSPEKRKFPEKSTSEGTPRPQKGDSAKSTFELFKKMKSLTEVAQARNLTLATIQSHLCEFVVSGEVSIFELVDEAKVKKLLPLVRHLPANASLGAVRQEVGEEFSYGDIKAVLAHVHAIGANKRNES